MVRIKDGRNCEISRAITLKASKVLDKNNQTNDFANSSRLIQQQSTSLNALRLRSELREKKTNPIKSYPNRKNVGCIMLVTPVK